MEHEAWNDSDVPRAILIFDIWNHLMTAAERDLSATAVAGIGDCYSATNQRVVDAFAPLKADAARSYAVPAIRGISSPQKKAAGFWPAAESTRRYSLEVHRQADEDIPSERVVDLRERVAVAVHGGQCPARPAADPCPCRLLMPSRPRHALEHAHVAERVRALDRSSCAARGACPSGCTSLASFGSELVRSSSTAAM